MSAGEGADRVQPILVLGLGNLLLRDDGVGLELLRRLRADFARDSRIEFVDGGTQGLALLACLSGRRAALILDAAALGAAPGEVHLLDDARRHAGPRGGGAHEGNAADLLAAAELLGDCPETVSLVGIEPAEVRTGIGLSDRVKLGLPRALDVARSVLAAWVEAIDAEPAACTS